MVSEIMSIGVKVPEPVKNPVTSYSNIALPTFCYRPGLNRRPSSPWLPEFSVTGNLEIQAYFDYALDLYNHGFYWEVHEIVERLWNFHRRGETSEGLFFQGFIFLAILQLKKGSGQTCSPSFLIKTQGRILSLKGMLILGVSGESLVAIAGSFLPK